MGLGASAAWIQEAGDVDSDPLYVEPDPGVGQGNLWLKELWHECMVVALFDVSLQQVCCLQYRCARSRMRSVSSCVIICQRNFVESSKGAHSMKRCAEHG